MTRLTDSLLMPRLCDLLQSIDKNEHRRLRLCKTCGQQIPRPYACPLDEMVPGRTALAQAQARNDGGSDA